MRRLLARLAIAVLPTRPVPVAPRSCRCGSAICAATSTGSPGLLGSGLAAMLDGVEPDHRTDRRIGRPR